MFADGKSVAEVHEEFPEWSAGTIGAHQGFVRCRP
jgi:hypothetical protein